MGEDFAGKPYAIARVNSRGGAYAATREINLQHENKVVSAGTSVVDVAWFCRIGVDGLCFSETDELQTISASRIIPVKMSWARGRHRSRRGARDVGKVLSSATDDRLVEFMQAQREEDEKV